MRPARTSRGPSSRSTCCAGTLASPNDDRRYAMAVLHTILGGGMSSRLFQEGPRTPWPGIHRECVPFQLQRRGDLRSACGLRPGETRPDP
ncbi:MAG: insulinase family protein [Micrococcales bacterium]|nr:insulinase family protein [Micrococcales bacterium]